METQEVVYLADHGNPEPIQKGTRLILDSGTHRTPATVELTKEADGVLWGWIAIAGNRGRKWIRLS